MVRGRNYYAMSAPVPSAALLRQLSNLLQSYQRLLGRPLVPPGEGDLWLALWDAPQVVVAHGCEADPVFFYGNRMALNVFEMDFAAFTKLPSRFSAEAPVREERAHLLERVRRDGYIDDYYGIRISSTGRRFRIEQAVVWNLSDEEGRPCGQAATFAHWRDLEMQPQYLERNVP